jgi:apolipoprotein N-acyltransferase
VLLNCLIAVISAIQRRGVPTMFKRTTTSTRSQDRLSYLWLAIAAVLFVFTSVRWTIPLAAWFAPLFLLRFVRTQRALPGLLLAWLVRAVVAAVVLQGIILYPNIVYYPLVVLLTGLTMLPYLADRLITPRLGGFFATLVFPLAYTTIEYLGSFGPFGTFYSIANTQYGDLPLLQVVSVTGIWGITFLITWFAAVVNWAWARGFVWRQVRAGALLYAAILAVVFLAGSARLVFFPPQATPVRIAGISASQAAVATFNRQLPQATLSLLESGKATQADRAIARSAFTTLDDGLLALSQQEARAGAKIVVWPEASPTGANILQEDEPALIQQAGVLARESGIYLDMGLGVFLPDIGKGPFLKDEAILLDPAGHVVWTYEKTHPAPGEQGLFVPSNGKIPTIESPYGRLANVICFDADFPGTVRQAGQAGVDLLLVPSDDWQAIDPYHTQVSTFRAIENGFSEVRQASKGLSMEVDYEGHVLSSSDYFTTNQQVLVANVPVQGVRTIYAVIGDLFAWLCIIGLVALIGLAIMRSRKRPPSAATTAPPSELQTTR